MKISILPKRKISQNILRFGKIDMGQLMSQVEFSGELMTDMAAYMTFVKQGSRGEKHDLYHEFVKDFCANVVEN